MHGVIAAVVASLVLLAGSACSRSGGEPAATGEKGVPEGWRVERDPDFTIAVPGDWRRSVDTSSAGNEFVSLTGPREVAGYPESVVIGRTPNVPEGDARRLAETFRMIHGDRTFGRQREVDVDGATFALLLESTRPQGEQRVPVKAWNVFVHSPSEVALNLEFVAPEEIFDEAMFRRILDTLTVLPRGPTPS